MPPPAHPEHRFERLAEYAGARFGIKSSVHFRWSAQVIEPVDGLPFIGHSPLSSRICVATGYSGNGMTFGTIAGMLLCDTILGRSNPWKDLAIEPNQGTHHNLCAPRRTRNASSCPTS